jgi:hypothetical protein
LPENTPFNWEWQNLAVYKLKGYGLSLEGEEKLAGRMQVIGMKYTVH